MWRKRTRPTPDDLTLRDDVHEAVAMRAETRAELSELRDQAPLVRRITSGLIDRQGKNHYIELLYQHIPGGAV